MSTRRWTSTDLPDLSAMTVIVTGASSGLGTETSRALAGAGARIVLAVRDTAKGERVAAGIEGNTAVRRLDLADLASVRRFAKDWTEPVDVLVNNAGIMAVPEARTVDGFESQIATNHLGPFALTHLLLPHITDRVVTVSSGLAARGEVDLQDLSWENRPYQRWAAYNQSKLANLLFTSELQRRLTAGASAVRALSAHPGIAATGLQQTGHRLPDLAMKSVFALVAPDAAHGALPTLFAATQDLPGGSYVGPDGRRGTRKTPRIVDPPKPATDRDLARSLWDLSARLTGVAAALPVAA